MLASKGFRMRASTRAGTLLLLLAIGLPMAPSPSVAAVRKDRTPPRFAGLKSAVTCIPGPVGGGKTTTYALSWASATDNRTPTRKIVYDVYQATEPGGEDFSAQTYTTDAGVTSFTTPELPTDTVFYFVVRAKDRAGNRDSNTIEREGQNLCD